MGLSHCAGDLLAALRAARIEPCISGPNYLGRWLSDRSNWNSCIFALAQPRKILKRTQLMNPFYDFEHLMYELPAQTG